MALREVLLLELRQAEVGDPDVASRVEQEVRRLDVAVDHPLAMRIRQRVGDLDADTGDLAIIAALGRCAGQRCARHLHSRFGHLRRRQRQRCLLVGTGLDPLGHRQLRDEPRGGARLEPPGLKRLADRAHGQGAFGFHRSDRGGASRRRGPELADVVEHLVERLARDVLHGVVVHAVLLAKVEDGHDVRVVQPGGRARLSAEQGEVRRVGPEPRVQDLQRHARAQRLALRLVHLAHPAGPDGAHDAVVGQPFGERAAHGRRGAGERGTTGHGIAQLGQLHLDEGREQVADLVGQLGMTRDVLFDAWTLAAAEPLQERVGQLLDRLALRTLGAHGPGSPMASGSRTRTDLILRRARR